MRIVYNNKQLRPVQHILTGYGNMYNLASTHYFLITTVYHYSRGIKIIQKS